MACKINQGWMRWTLGSFLLAMLAGSGLRAADFRAGVDRVDITPRLPIWMSGYAARTRPAQEVIQNLWAKALVLEDKAGKKVALVAIDLIGLPAEVTRPVAAEVQKKFGIERSCLVLNTSHTHSGPIVRPNLNVMYDLPAADAEHAEEYRRSLVEKLVQVVGGAVESLQPAKLDAGTGSAGFAINRRQATEKGVIIGTNSGGPSDTTVPVLRVLDRKGQLLAVLFGYACHNTTLGGDSYRINGDYAGFAQVEVELKHPGATALFFIQCAADQNPNPRGTLEHVMRYGKELAAAVEKVLEQKLEPVKGPLRAAYREVPLEFAGHTREQFEKESQGQDVFRRRRAQLMLAAYDRGAPVRSVAYPVQAVRLGDRHVLTALAGEVVVDYGLRIRKEFGPQMFLTAGYCNEVMAYIPSRRILQEGGYEAVDSMIYYGQPGPFQDSVEEAVFGALRQVLKEIGTPAAR